MMIKLYYCKRCAGLQKSDGSEKCEFCNNDLTPVPEEYLSETLCCFESSKKEDDFILENICGNPEYDKKLHFQQAGESWIKMLEDRKKEKLEEQEKKNTPYPRTNPHDVKCPYCQSLHVEKIPATDRLFSVGFFGLGSKKVGKQWRCVDCKSYF